MDLSVVVPTLNEAGAVADTLRCARQPGVREIIVVDGGSTDATVEIARPLADLVIPAARGRAPQMNAGGARASGDILLFLHADTLLPPGFAAEIVASCQLSEVVGGRFDVELRPSSPLLWITGELINRRSRLTGIASGDQAIFIRREVFARLGGYAEMPLMEDLDLSRRMKRAGTIACLRSRVVTSSRRWRQDGVVRTILLMWTLRGLYYAGVSPERLHRLYKNTR